MFRPSVIAFATDATQVFAKKSYVEQIMDAEEEDARVKCVICDKVFKNKANFTAHKKYIHGNRERKTCATCHKTFSTKGYLERHTETVHCSEERPRLSCTFPGCDKSFLTKAYLSEHVKSNHVESPKIRTVSEKTLKCPLCERLFAKIGTLKRHELTHVDKSTRLKFTCNLCPRIFLSNSRLKSHIQAKHENQRNYKCTLCDRRFARADNLKCHMEAIHPADKEATYSCDKCEYKSHTKFYLAQHAKRHRHDESSTKCGCCFCGNNTLMDFSTLIGSLSRRNSPEK
ncbi:zinc finger protein 28 [Folsomia candida]|nr:zinc finger protein 28 [Folsomia candida]XP_035713734.1 zinc finger protein 28 [Folsomia candida]XP_035713735.1 zinc finger protein 28 [Folsomia candida]